MIRLYARRDDRVLAGGALAGATGEHLAHLRATLVQWKVMVDDAQRLPFYHPTYEENLKEGLRALLQALN